MTDHTMDELYHHRAVLFAIVVNDRPAMSWKSKLHHDGTMINGMFVVGLNSPYGQITYHYLLEEWDLFKCEEVPFAPKWDGIVGGSISRLEMMARNA
jgi:hypothetical protein